MQDQQMQRPVEAPVHQNSVADNTVSIPDHFMKLLCCACTCASCEWPSCFGCKQAGTCLCCDGHQVCCKPIQDEKACCLCWAVDHECVNPQTFCKCYKQICCFECFVAIPSVEHGYRATPVAFIPMPNKEDGKGDLSNVTICSGGCCTITSCNCDFPSCLGCYSKSVCLCCESELIQNKFMCCDDRKSRPETLCICAKGNYSCVMPYTCCKYINQQCCIDSRGACPCDDDVPCVYSLLPFCVCCVNGQCQCGCCMTIGDALRLKMGLPPGAPLPEKSGHGMAQQGQNYAQQPVTVNAQPVVAQPMKA